TGKPHPSRRRDVVEKHECPERAGRLIGIEEGIHHREPVAQYVGQCDCEQLTVSAALSPPPSPIFHHTGFDVAVLHHDGVVQNRHPSHPPAPVPPASLRPDPPT